MFTAGGASGYVAEKAEDPASGDFLDRVVAGS